MTELTKFAAPLGRVLLALIFITSGWGKLWAIGGTMGYMQAMGVPGILIYPTILLELVGGIMLLVGYQARITALLLGGFTLLAGLLFHLIPAAGDQMQLISFWKNVSITGGLLMIVSMGAGAYSLDNRSASGEAQPV